MDADEEPLAASASKRCWSDTGTDGDAKTEVKPKKRLTNDEQSSSSVNTNVTCGTNASADNGCSLEVLAAAGVSCNLTNNPPELVIENGDTKVKGEGGKEEKLPDGTTTSDGSQATLKVSRAASQQNEPITLTQTACNTEQPNGNAAAPVIEPVIASTSAATQCSAAALKQPAEPEVIDLGAEAPAAIAAALGAARARNLEQLNALQGNQQRPNAPLSISSGSEMDFPFSPDLSDNFDPRSSSSDSSSPPYIEASDTGESSSDSLGIFHPNRTTLENQVCEVLEKPLPLYSINTSRELLRREHGLFGYERRFQRMGANNYFNQAYWASRQTVERMQIEDKLNKHEGCVNSANFNAAGNLLCTGSDDTYVIIWDWAAKKLKYCYRPGHEDNIFQTKFVQSVCTNTSFMIVSSSRDGHVRAAQILTSGKAIARRLYSHKGPVHKLVVCPQVNQQIISAGEDGAIISHDLRMEISSNIKRVVGRDNRRIKLYSISHHPFKDEICVAGNQRYVNVYDKRHMSNPVYKMCPAGFLKFPFSQITSACYNYNGTEIVASYSYGNIYLFSNEAYRKGDYLHCYKGHYNHRTIKGVNFFGPNSEYIVSGSDCGHVFFWSKETEGIVKFFPGDLNGVVNCLEPHPSMPVLATTGLDKSVKIWLPCGDSPGLDKPKLRRRVWRNIGHTIIEEYSAHNNPHYPYDENMLQMANRRWSGDDDVSSSYSSTSSIIHTDTSITMSSSSGSSRSTPDPTGPLTCTTQ